ncbi:MAG: class I SAM-dependent DNA methyltransferase [Synergistaceae bacterium]|nr:class I SAM-dependent DNA methyltransferase [Synergistaceae bacterium]
MNTDSKITEKSNTQVFWLKLLRDVLGLEYPEKYIEFEKRVELHHMSFIDAYIPSTRIIIEQKGPDVDLDTPIKQSDGTSLTPFEQAKRYYDWLPMSQKGRYIITCNFREIRIHDMETPKAPPRIILLENIEREKDNLTFIAQPGRTLPHEVELSIKAGKLVRKLYDSLLGRYINPNSKDSLRNLSIFCVRVVFLLYAEDSGLFAKFQFHDYLKAREKTARDSLKRLFAVLNQRPHERDPYLEAALKVFPRVNGGLFEADDIEFPQLDGEPLRIILEDMSEGFNWSGISPTIFGAIFESTLNPETRDSGGMHYTSLENIHKVIDPLFLDGLNKELDTCDTPAKLRRLQKKLASLKFFDPACGSGNFLTESYLSLRRLENEIINTLVQSSYTLPRNEPLIKVSISQFYGIEINDFAVNVAKTALWIAESQMWNATRSIVEKNQQFLPLLGEFLPLNEYGQITEDDALKLDWQKIIAPQDNLFIISNPPFLGYSTQNKEQKKEIKALFADTKTSGKIDYVSGWYYKACEFMKGSKVKAAFVSTNSITQGEQVSYVFKTLRDRFGIEIDFAHQSFIWDSEATDKAHVHCVVIGFSMGNDSGKKKLFTDEGLRLVDNINFYLYEGPYEDIAESVNKPLSKNIPPMLLGNLPRDGGFLSLDPKQCRELLKRTPKAEKFIRRYIGADEFISNKLRYVLWLVDATPQELYDMPRVKKLIESVKKFRLESPREATRKLADTSWLFAEIRQPSGNYVAVPLTSSENRTYIPVDFISPDVIVSNAISIIPNATLYHFGVLTSRVHMAWMRRVAGRLKSDYRYSGTLVYNTFAWPSPTKRQIAKIESTAQMILDARNLHPDSSFASLYNDTLMPKELKKAHTLNDEAVCEAYGWDKDISEDEITARLFRLYHQLTE